VRGLPKDHAVAALHVCATPINRAGQYTTLPDATDDNLDAWITDLNGSLALVADRHFASSQKTLLIGPGPAHTAPEAAFGKARFMRLTWANAVDLADTVEIVPRIFRIMVAVGVVSGRS
jgi:hypothetical protein